MVLKVLQSLCVHTVRAEQPLYGTEFCSFMGLLERERPASAVLSRNNYQSVFIKSIPFSNLLSLMRTRFSASTSVRVVSL